MTSLSADDSFLNHYGFSHDPFAPRVPGFKFFPAQRKPVLGQLHHLARYSQLLLVVTGPEGSGKTLVRQALVASSNKQAVQSVVITPQDTADSSVLLQQIAQALNVARADYDAIMAQVIQLALTGQEVYLLVDDADRLTGAAVETLLRLAAGNPEGRPHVFLFGEPALVGRLEALVEGEGRFHAIALQPYEEDETREYLTLRLEGAGAGLDCFTEEQIASIHERSGGWPGVINEVARDELLEAMQSAKSRKRGGGWQLPLPGKHLLAVVALLCIIAAVFLLRSGDKPQFEPTTTQLPLDGGGQVAAGSPATSIEFAEEEAAAPPAAPEPLMREPLAAAASPEDEGGGADALEEPFPEGVPPAEIVPPAPVATAAPQPAPQQPAAAPAPAPVPQVRQPVATAPVPQPTPRPQVAAPARTTTAGWYATQPATHFLVQVLGTGSQSKAQSLVSRYGGNFHFFTKQHQGKPLYVLTYGSFASRDAAVAAIRALPAELQAGKPWIRSFASVQQEIGQSR